MLLKKLYFLIASLVLMSAGGPNRVEGFGTTGVRCFLFDLLQTLQIFFTPSTTSGNFTNNNLIPTYVPPDCVYWPPVAGNYINNIDTSISCRNIQPQSPFDYKRV
jgi:hypothetical protein